MGVGEQRPHIVLIVLDTQRVDRLGCYGYPRQTSPSIDAFAHQLGTDHSPQTVLGLELDGELIGVVVATHDGRKGWINRLAVDPDHRRRNHASRLVATAEAVLREQGIHVIAALVESDNLGSLALFRKMDYVETESGIHYLTKRDSEDA